MVEKVHQQIYYITTDNRANMVSLDNLLGIEIENDYSAINVNDETKDHF